MELNICVAQPYPSSKRQRIGDTFGEVSLELSNFSLTTLPKAIVELIFSGLNTSDATTLCSTNRSFKKEYYSSIIPNIINEIDCSVNPIFEHIQLQPEAKRANYYLRSRPETMNYLRASEYLKEVSRRLSIISPDKSNLPWVRVTSLI